MTEFSPAVFAGLKDFQRNSVEYVLRRLYTDDDCTDRFLVADEVGLGKTLVAKGVIAGAIEHLQHDDKVDRIDVIYICSNAEIARQNIGKLAVDGGGGNRPLSTRMTLLATQLRDLDRKMADGSKTINLVAFTPGTSFDKGSHGGRVEERALLCWLLEPLFTTIPDRWIARRNALRRILQMEVGAERWNRLRAELNEPESAPDENVSAKFRAAAQSSDVFDRLHALVEEVMGRSQLTEEQRIRRGPAVGGLRQLLARVSVEYLEPDLIILDEFQRFKHLLRTPEEGSEQEVSELANDLFSAPQAKVLLLSATPYKMFTLADEREVSGDDHYQDFLATFEFLSLPRAKADVPQLRAALSRFRRDATSGHDAGNAKNEVEALLRRSMCRTERPVVGREDMLSERTDRPLPPTASDLVGFCAMQRIADEVGSGLSVEYWKSAPYFLNFMDGYQLSEKFRQHSMNYWERKVLLDGAQFIRADDLTEDADIEPGNARLRHLATETIDRDLWKLLWLPPSMPYYEAQGAYAGIEPTTVTKHLIFSSWAAAPSAIAALLSWAALRRMKAGPGRTVPSARLNYRLDGGRPAGMSALALFMPIPGLADRADPLSGARRSPQVTLSAETVLDEIEHEIAADIPSAGRADIALSQDTWLWASPFIVGGTGTSCLEAEQTLTEQDLTEDGSGLRTHLELADQAARGEVDLGSQPPDLARWVARIGCAGPGNVAYRALRRATADTPAVTELGLWRAAAAIGAGFRSLFNRPEVMTLLDSMSEDDGPYWQTVLDYCVAGNLQAVVDEYVHHLVGNETINSDDKLLDLAGRVQSVLALRTAPIQAFDPQSPSKPLRFNARFALRYGSARGAARTDDQSLARSADVQGAFNSPFWPMVLASTSVGQEGVDFHWWCHSLVHWNLPANPVDFEQREGRVHRFKGHAVRKNVAAAHRAEALGSDDVDPWNAAFRAAEAQREPGRNDLWPWWVYPGDAKIERWVPSLPMSKDREKEVVLQRQRALYRLAFGQPRQEDLLKVLDQQGLVEDPDRLADLRIDLSPQTLSNGR